VAKKFAGRIGFFVRDLASGVDYGWNPDQRFPPARVPKLPVMIELYRQAADGRLDLEEKLRLPAGISTHGTGVLKKKSRPVGLPLREYADLMMIHRNNMTTGFIIGTVSTKVTNAFLNAQVFRNTRVSLELGRWHEIVCGIPDLPITIENDKRLIEQIKVGPMDNDGLLFRLAGEQRLRSARNRAAVGTALQRSTHWRKTQAGDPRTNAVLEAQRHDRTSCEGPYTTC